MGMNASATPIVKRLTVAVAMASVVVGGALLAARASGADVSPPAPTASVSGSSTTALAPPTSSTTITAPASASPTTSHPATDPGDASVLFLQRRLAELGYDVGTPDGRLGQQTAAAVMAFQKVEGLARTGTAGPEVTAALAKATPPRPLVPGGEATRVEIDLGRQVLFLWKDGRLARILPVSTGSGRRYCQGGVCQTASTPKGIFHIGRKVAGVDPGPLGVLYNPLYFNGGIAIHGAPSVPATPASHGCARIPMYASASFFQQVPSGTAVYVV